MNLAIEIGGTKLQLAIADTKSSALQKIYRYDIDRSLGSKGILHTIETTINAMSSKPKNIGIGFGGPINRKTGVIAASHQIEGWSGFNLKDWFLQRYGATIYMENDANVAALAEARYGAGSAHDKVFYVTLGSGVGGGMVIDKELYVGNFPGESEIGLIKLKKGKSTLESLCSGWALNKVIRKAITQKPNSKLATLVGDNNDHEAKYLKKAIEYEDELALDIFDEYCDILAYGLSFVVHLFNPEVIVIGGGVSLIGDHLTQSLSQNLPKYISTTYHPGPTIQLSTLGEEVVLRGALSLIP